MAATRTKGNGVVCLCVWGGGDDKAVCVLLAVIGWAQAREKETGSGGGVGGCRGSPLPAASARPQYSGAKGGRGSGERKGGRGVLGGQEKGKEMNAKERGGGQQPWWRGRGARPAARRSVRARRNRCRNYTMRAEGKAELGGGGRGERGCMFGGGERVSPSVARRGGLCVCSRATEERPNF